MSNFQTHSVLPTGQDTPGFALNNSGVTFYSVQLSSKDINYPWLLGNQQTPVSAIPLAAQGLRQIPGAFEDGNGTTIAPAYNLRPRNIMPTSWWLWWIARVDVAGQSYTPPTATSAAKINGFSVIPDLQRLAVEQQNSPVHAAWFYRFNLEKQWRSRNLIAEAPNQFFSNLAANASHKSDYLWNNLPFTQRDVNTLNHTGVNNTGNAVPVYVERYGLMVSGMQARGPPTWNSFYERIFNLNDVPLQKYGNAFTLTDRQANNGKQLVQSSFAQNGQGYGVQGIKDLWAIAWRVPNDPTGTPVPLTIEFVMETQIDIECKHFDSQTDLNGIICRPIDTFAVNALVDPQSLSNADYAYYLRDRGYHHGYSANMDASNGMMVQYTNATAPHSFQMPQSSFARHVALESDNYLTRLDGCVNPGGQSNYANGYEGQNAINRSMFTNKQIIDTMNNTNNLDNLQLRYQGPASAFIAP